MAATWSNYPVFLSFPQIQKQGWLWSCFFSQIDPLIVVFPTYFLSNNACSEIKWHISMFRNDTEIRPDNPAHWWFKVET